MDSYSKENKIRIGVVVAVGLIILIILRSVTKTSVKYDYKVKQSSPKIDLNTIIDTNEFDVDVCHTEECLEVASTFSSNLNEDVNPCDNFYEFACGGWKAKNPRPKDADRWSPVDKLTVDEQIKLINILATDKRLEEQPGAMKKANTFFDSCLTLRLNGFGTLDELSKIITEMQDFPILNKNWNESIFSWQASYVYADTNFLQQPFFNYSVVDFPHDAPYIQISAPQYYQIAHILEDPHVPQNVKTENETEFRKFMRAYVNVISIEAQVTLSDKEIDGMLDDMIKFERELVKIGIPYYETVTESNKVDVNFTDLNVKFPELNLEELFTQLFDSVNIKLNKNDTIKVNDVAYFKKLAKVLNSTSKETLANYINLMVLRDFGELPISAVIRGLQRGEKLVLCATLTEQIFGLALSRYYVKYYLQELTVRQMKEFVNLIEAALANTFTSKMWMDKETKSHAQKKLRRLISYIAIPSWIATDDDLNKVYGDMNPMQELNFLRNRKKGYIWLKKRLLKQIRPQNESIVDIVRGGPSEVNAFNQIMENIIRVKIGILNPPFYYHNAPTAVNFGSIGYVLAHEILHGFDNQGSQYDYEGHKKMWWSNKTWDVYEKKVQCFVDQYNQFTEPVTGQKVNGTLTIGENIADNGGIYQSFVAYKMYASFSDKFGLNKKLPNQMSKYTKDQLFYISFANTYCNNDSPDFIRKQLKQNVHSPFYARVVVPLQNSEHFSDAFRCKKGSQMNPIKKCVLW